MSFNSIHARACRSVLLAGAASLFVLPALAAGQTTTTPQGENVAPPVSSEVGLDRPQDQGATAGADTDAVKDIIVTGTFIRGIAPVGTSVINVDRSAVIASGAKSTIDLLADVPQITNFFNRVNVPTTNFGNPANRPSIRGLPTLLLLNGFRIVGTGLIQTSPEPNQVSPGSIERVEVIPGSGASIYGSDAVGGVINFITRRRMNGVEASARYGIADNLRTQDGQITVGHAWEGGSLYASYSYAHHDRILTRERDYFTQDLRRYGGSDFRTTACPVGNVVVGGVTYGLPNRTVGANLCDRTQNADFYPRETRHNALLGFTQELNSSLTFDASAYFSRRTTNIRTATASTSLTITSANPFFRPIGTERSQTVSFAYDPVYGPTGDNLGRFDSWGVTPQLTVKLGGDWQSKIGANFGHSFNYNSAYENNAIAQGAAINGTTTATALNPYDLTQTNPAVLAGIFNSRTIAITKQELQQGRVTFDGSLFQLNGNSAKLAIGGELLKYVTVPTLSQGPTPGAVYVATRNSRTIASGFGELVVPFIGPDNDVPLINRLTVSGSARYDKYSDVGGTFNPKFAGTYEPFEGLQIIGNWGKNFRAPDLSDVTPNSVDARNQYLSSSGTLRPGDTPAVQGRRPTILLAGGNPNLKPEKSTTWSVGADFRPTFISGLSLGVTYFNTRFRDRIAVLTPSVANFANPSIAYLFTFNPTLAQAQALLGPRRNDGFSTVESLYAGGTDATQPYVIADARRQNIGRVKLDGLDGRANYNHDFGGLSLSAGVGGTYLLKQDTQQAPGAIFNQDLENGVPRLSLTANVGARFAGFSARVNFTELGSYPIRNIVGQTRVDDFEVVDLFFSYDLEKAGLPGTQITLNVDNVTDAIPPFINQGTGRANGSTLGRAFTIGLSTRF